MWVTDHRTALALLLVAQFPIQATAGEGGPVGEELQDKKKYDLDPTEADSHNEGDLDRAISFFIVLVATFLIAYFVKYALERRKNAKRQKELEALDDENASRSSSDSDSYDVFDQALQPIELESFNGIPQSEIDQFASLQKEAGGGLGTSTGSCNPITNLSDSMKKQQGGRGPPPPRPTPPQPPPNAKGEGAQPQTEQHATPPVATINLPPPPSSTLPREKPRGKSD